LKRLTRVLALQGRRSLCIYAIEIRGSLYVAKFTHLAKKKGVLATTCTKDFFWGKKGVKKSPGKKKRVEIAIFRP
jgi:hypothetical protein